MRDVKVKLQPGEYTRPATKVAVTYLAEGYDGWLKKLRIRTTPLSGRRIDVSLIKWGLPPNDS